MNSTRPKYIFYSLTIFGLLISIYLFYRHLTLMDLSIGGGADFCSELFNLSCDDALKSPIANMFGIPLAGWGIIYYVSIIIIFAMGDFLEDTFKGAAEELLVVVTGVTSLISFMFIISFALSLISFCPLCLLIHIINISLLFIAINLSSKSFTQSIISFYSGIEEFFVTKGPIPKQTRQQIIPLLLIAALAMLFYQWIFMQGERLELMEEYSFDELHFFEEYEKEKVVDLRISSDDPVLGPDDALISMVIFSDFQCSGCRGVSQGIKNLLSRYSTELNIRFKNYPLSSQCNSSMRSDLHPNACSAAYAAEAAHLQGKFWEYHDLLFSSSIDGEEEEFLDYAEELDLDISMFRNDMNTVAKEKVAEDINLGNELGIEGTPTVYVNGRKITELSFKALDWLVGTMHGIIKKRSSN